MTTVDPRRQPPTKPPISLVTWAALFAALTIGIVLQEVRWRGGFSGVAASPIESGPQQLKLAELAFRNGNDALALNLFDRLAAKNDATAQYWVAHMTE